MAAKMKHGANDPIALLLCHLVGAPKNVRSIEYRAAIDEVSVVTVTYLPEIDDAAVAAELGPLVQKYRLQEVEPEGSGSA